MKYSFEYLTIQEEVLFNLCKNPEDFVESFISLIKSSGWTEEEYYAKVDSSIFESKN
jgi:hypothetical protein